MKTILHNNIIFQFSSLNLHQPANIEPDRLCQILKIAPGKAAAAEKYFTANATLNPEFCIPTSIPIVLQVFLSYFKSRGTKYPNDKPIKLCKITAATIIKFISEILDLFNATIIAMINTIAKVEINGNKFLILFIFFPKNELIAVPEYHRN